MRIKGMTLTRLRSASEPCSLSPVFCGPVVDMSTDSRVIIDAMSDDEVGTAIGQELDRRMPPQDDLDVYVASLRTLPVGLRSMAAIYQLDVSLALDDLGWHFGNWHHHGYAQETAAGLRVLGAQRAAELFEAAYAEALHHWDRLAAEDWMEWYHESPPEAAVDPLNREMWQLYPSSSGGLLRLWVQYARAHSDVLQL
jgi:hypothetical protein